MRLSREFIAQALAQWPVARLSTLGESGHPSPVPVVFIPQPGELWSPIDGKPKRVTASERLGRIGNLVRDPRVGVLLDHDERDWQRLWWIRLQGEAEVVCCERPESDAQLAPVGLKYPQYRETSLFTGTPTLVRVRVQASEGWAAGEARARETLAISPGPASPDRRDAGSG